jgi:hypothetical protein
VFNLDNVKKPEVKVADKNKETLVMEEPKTYQLNKEDYAKVQSMQGDIDKLYNKRESALRTMIGITQQIDALESLRNGTVSELAKKVGCPTLFIRGIKDDGTLII